jgi:serine phosphatase RsbU (regulator of sigma subunit)
MKLPAIFQSVLTGVDMTYALVDEDGYVVEHDPLFSLWILDSQDSLVGQELLDILPEFFGQEELLEDVRQGKTPFFRLENINRASQSGEIYYLRLIVVQAETNMLVLAANITELSLHMQDLTQARNELSLKERQLNESNTSLKLLNKRLQDELSMARRIQRGLLPSSKPKISDLDVVCCSTQAREVGGDFFTYYAMQKNRVLLSKHIFAIGDVSGKGVSAALLMATSLSQVDASLSMQLSPAERLVFLDKILMPYTKAQRQNCALCVVEIIGVNTAQPIAKIVNAGCIPPYIKRANGQVEWQEIGGFALGQGLGAEFGYVEIKIKLFKGDTIILTSDGIVEANNKAGEMLGFDRLMQIIADGPTTNSEAMLEHINHELATFTGKAEQHDDMTVIVIRV